MGLGLEISVGTDSKGGVTVTKAVKILALPRRGRGGLTPAKIFLVDLSQCTEANLK